MHDVDELVVISGYLGPKPVQRLGDLPFNSRVVYGMYGSEGVKSNLHNSLSRIQNSEANVDIFYSKLPVHSKCYIWRKRGEISHALIGSANFSVNGLTTPYREILAETTLDTFVPLNKYLKLVMNNSISCLEAMPYEQREPMPDVMQNTHLASLLANDGQVQNAAGLNWGQNPRNHTNLDDAYIPIRASTIRNYPELFPAKKSKPMEVGARGNIKRHNDFIEIIWDDGLIMQGLLEGSMVVDGAVYPKQISSSPSKAEMGSYLRERIGVPSGQPVRAHHLKAYGRSDIKISLLEEGIYSFDFSV